jgi:hypothetical protein
LSGSASLELKSEEEIMLQSFLKVGGPLQALLGLAGSAAPGLAGTLGTATGGSIFNILSGGALSYLGFGANPALQAQGAKIVGGLNVLVGVLNALGVRELGGLPINEGNVATVVNLGLGAWGLLAGFMAKK